MLHERYPITLLSNRSKIIARMSYTADWQIRHAVAEYFTVTTKREEKLSKSMFPEARCNGVQLRLTK